MTTITILEQGLSSQNVPPAQGTVLAGAKAENTVSWLFVGYKQPIYYNNYLYYDGNLKTVFNGHIFTTATAPCG